MIIQNLICILQLNYVFLIIIFDLAWVLWNFTKVTCRCFYTHIAHSLGFIAFKSCVLVINGCWYLTWSEIYHIFKKHGNFMLIIQTIFMRNDNELKSEHILELWLLIDLCWKIMVSPWFPAYFLEKHSYMKMYLVRHPHKFWMIFVLSYYWFT